MPLQLGDVSTERDQLIVFNPTVPAEHKDAEKRRNLLLRQGFSVKEETDGRVVLTPPTKAPHMGVFRILSDNGDDRVVWDRTIPGQVKEAYQKFKDFLAKGYTAFVTLSNGNKGHKIEDFDPGLEEILLIPSTMPG